jgi:hypothetical protein
MSCRAAVAERCVFSLVTLLVKAGCSDGAAAFRGY